MYLREVFSTCANRLVCCDVLVYAGINAAYISGVVLHQRIRINLSLNVIVCCYKEIAEAPARYRETGVFDTGLWCLLHSLFSSDTHSSSFSSLTVLTTLGNKLTPGLTYTYTSSTCITATQISSSHR